MCREASSERVSGLASRCDRTSSPCFTRPRCCPPKLRFHGHTSTCSGSSQRHKKRALDYQCLASRSSVCGPSWCSPRCQRPQASLGAQFARLPPCAVPADLAPHYGRINGGTGRPCGARVRGLGLVAWELAAKLCCVRVTLLWRVELLWWVITRSNFWCGSVSRASFYHTSPLRRTSVVLAWGYVYIRICIDDSSWNPFYLYSS